MNRLSLLMDMCDSYPIVFDIIWALSFNRDIQVQLRSNASFMSKLVHLPDVCDSAQVRKVVHGIVWNLESNNDDDRTRTDKDEELLFDIMISYSHKDKILCKRLYDELVASGYRVWIDFDQMHGNVMDAMAQAIERSRTMVICMSEQYRRSNYCRAEAHYAFKRQLKIVPVLLQEHYKPDGWLVFLIGQLLYVDFTKQNFEHAMVGLLNELKAPILRQESQLGAQPRELTKSPRPSFSAPSPPVLPESMLEWTSVHVHDWLIGNGLKQMALLLADYTGASLIPLNTYLTSGEPQLILNLLHEDAIRRTHRALSLVELAHFQGLLGRQVASSVDKQRTSTKCRRYAWVRSKFCGIS